MGEGGGVGRGGSQDRIGVAFWVIGLGGAVCIIEHYSLDGLHDDHSFDLTDASPSDSRLTSHAILPKKSNIGRLSALASALLA